MSAYFWHLFGIDMASSGVEWLSELQAYNPGAIVLLWWHCHQFVCLVTIWDQGCQWWGGVLVGFAALQSWYRCPDVEVVLSVYGWNIFGTKMARGEAVRLLMCVPAILTWTSCYGGLVISM